MDPCDKHRDDGVEGLRRRLRTKAPRPRPKLIPHTCHHPYPALTAFAEQARLTRRVAKAAMAQLVMQRCVAGRWAPKLRRNEGAERWAPCRARVPACGSSGADARRGRDSSPRGCGGADEGVTTRRPSGLQRAISWGRRCAWRSPQARRTGGPATAFVLVHDGGHRIARCSGFSRSRQFSCRRTPPHGRRNVADAQSRLRASPEKPDARWAQRSARPWAIKEVSRSPWFCRRRRLPHGRRNAGGHGGAGVQRKRPRAEARGQSIDT